jgi:hypothetical protein
VIGGHCPWSEELIQLSTLVREMVRIPRVDALEGFNYVKIDGRTVDNPVLAIYAARRAAAYIREGLRAGRPDWLSSTTLFTKHSPLCQSGRSIRGTDGVLLSVLPDMKVERHDCRLTRL